MSNTILSGKRLLIAVLFIAVLPATIFAQAETSGQKADEVPQKNVISAKEYGIILNLSGKQRMLTQKMCKETLLVVAGINKEANKVNLKNSFGLFSKTLAGLKDGDDSLELVATENSRIRKQLDSVKLLFDELAPIFTKAISGAKPTEDELKFLKDKNVPLLLAMNKAVKMYERKSKSVIGGDSALNVIINLAGKQRMLTQKMSKEFLFIKLGIDVENNRMALRETIALFNKTLTGLQQGDADLGLPPTSDQKILTQLNVVQDLWKPFKPVIENASDVTTTEIPLEDVKKVAELNIPLLVNMNKAVKMYETLTK